MAISESGSIPSLPRSPPAPKNHASRGVSCTWPHQAPPKQWWDSMWLLPNGSKCSRSITFQSPSHSLGRSHHFWGASSKFVPSVAFSHSRSLCSIGELKPANVASPQLDLTLHPAASLCQAFGATSSPKTGAKRAPTWSLSTTSTCHFH